MNSEGNTLVRTAEIRCETVGRDEEAHSDQVRKLLGTLEFARGGYDSEDRGQTVRYSGSRDSDGRACSGVIDQLGLQHESERFYLMEMLEPMGLLPSARQECSEYC